MTNATLITALDIFGGMLIGFLFGQIFRSRRSRKDSTPTPVDLGYDESNPINGGQPRHGEYVEMGGVTWRIM